MARSALSIQATDLSAIRNIDDQQDRWLRKLARTSDLDARVIRLSGGSSEAAEPIVRFDAQSGTWWTGRYVGEVIHQGGRLTIAPRFGVAQLQRWLSRIWGVRLLSSKGKYEHSRLWLWELLGRLWEAQLLAGAKHGLPTRRVDRIHRGQALRGRLDVRMTAREIATGRGTLVSRSRERLIDRQISTILLSAFEQLRRRLDQLADPRSWMSPRGQTIVQEFQSHGADHGGEAISSLRSPVRYTPITQSYQPVVDLSLSILKNRPLSSSAEGQSDVMGVLIDMAEVWELYVYHLLRSSLIGSRVLHTGRCSERADALFQSDRTGQTLGRLKPDILITDLDSETVRAVLDAKYKSTKPADTRPYGVHREDLYQINAYVSAFGSPGKTVSGALIYPSGAKGFEIGRLQVDSPWRSLNHDASVWLLGIDCQSDTLNGEGLTDGEDGFLRSVRAMTGVSE